MGEPAQALKDSDKKNLRDLIASAKRLAGANPRIA